MRIRALPPLAAAVLGLCACRHAPMALVPQSYVPPPLPTARQQMAALAFLAYVGGDLKGSDDDVERTLAPCLREALAGQPVVAGWTLAWGPSVYKFELAELDDNMMYVARRDGAPGHLAIAVRGTNPKAILDWLVEDFEVREEVLVPWAYGSPPERTSISKSTAVGLQVLQTMTPAQPPGQTLLDFLKAERAAVGAPLQIDVTGHSLGGALSPTLALWLTDTQQDWDGPDLGSRIAVYPLAGPTPGNAGFAAYYTARLGRVTDRMHGPFDVVPLAWNVETMGTIAELYQPVAPADAIERGLIDGLLDVVKDKGYTQITATPPLAGALAPAERSFAAQAAWQHHCGYQCPLGIRVPLTRDCLNPPSTVCVCP